MPVHADEQSALVRGGQNGIAVPGFFRIEDGDAGGIDSWMSHIRSPCVVRRNFCPAGLMFFFGNGSTRLREHFALSALCLRAMGSALRRPLQIRAALCPGSRSPRAGSFLGHFLREPQKPPSRPRTPSLPSLLIHQLASSVLFAALNA